MRNAETDADKRDDSWRKYDLAGCYWWIDARCSAWPAVRGSLGQTRRGRPCISVLKHYYRLTTEASTAVHYRQDRLGHESHRIGLWITWMKTGGVRGVDRWTDHTDPGTRTGKEPFDRLTNKTGQRTRWSTGERDWQTPLNRWANETGPGTRTDKSERQIFGTDTRIQSVTWFVHLDPFVPERCHQSE
jgi:hypothetical protein